MSVKVRFEQRQVYYAECPVCGFLVDGPTEKRVEYLLRSHEYFIHERGLAQ
jgi:hypothetical protein